MTTPVLSGLTVLALTEEAAAGPARLLSLWGADVRRVEPERLPDVAAEADVAIETLPPGRLDELGVGYERLRAINPRLVLTSLTPFGQTGPYAGYRGDELVVSALSGVMYGCGFPDRPPVREGLDSQTYAAELAAVCATLLAWRAARRDGVGQHVDVAAQHVGAIRDHFGHFIWQFDRREEPRAGAYRLRSRWTWQCRDRAVYWGPHGTAPTLETMSAWLDDEGADNPLAEVGDSYPRDLRGLDPHLQARVEDVLDAFFAGRTADETVSEGTRRGLDLWPVVRPDELLGSAQLADRDFWDERDGIRVPGRLIRIEEGPRSDRAAEGDNGSGDARPLAGVRVLDFGWAIVGALTSKLLADYGATVVRVESRGRLDGTRALVQVEASRPDNPDDKPWYSVLNTSKLSLALDLKHPRAGDVLDRLVEWADVVNENFSPGTLDRLGYGYEQMSRRNPGVVMASTSAFGRSGPLGTRSGLDHHVLVTAGHVEPTGWPDRLPIAPAGAYADVHVPLATVAAIVAALDRRRRTGEGAHLDVSMLEVCAHASTNALQAFQRDGRIVERSGNRIPGSAPYGVFPCRGDDRWCAIAVCDDEAWRALAHVLGDWASEPRFATLPGRKQHEDELEERLSAWTAERDADEVMEACQGIGVPAGVVRSPREIVETDPQLRHRGLFVTLPHGVLEPFGHPTIGFSLPRTAAVLTAAPRFGADSEEVCRSLLGMPDELVAELAAEGLFA